MNNNDIQRVAGRQQALVDATDPEGLGPFTCRLESAAKESEDSPRSTGEVRAELLFYFCAFQSVFEKFQPSCIPIVHCLPLEETKAAAASFKSLYRYSSQEDDNNNNVSDERPTAPAHCHNPL